MSAQNPNHSERRFGDCIQRLRARVGGAERELRMARQRAAEAHALIAADAEWTTQDGIYADESYVRDFARRLQWQKNNLASHEAFFRELHGKVCL